MALKEAAKVAGARTLKAMDGPEMTRPGDVTGDQPELGEPDTVLNVDPLPDNEDRIGRACRDLIADWRRGERRPVESYVGGWPGGSPSPDDLFELVYAEYLVREEAGLPTFGPLSLRFPALADRLKLQAQLHEALLGGDSEGIDLLATVTRLDFDPQASFVSSGYPSPVGYEVGRLLGRGGMGVVYEARQILLNRMVALKMIRAGDLASPEERTRFLAEAEVIARLKHPNIVQIHAFGECDGRPFFEMELVDGGSLADRIQGAPHSPREASTLLETLARAIHEAHRNGVIHRDLKPSNILMMADGSPKIVDFGLAKLIGSNSGLTRTDSVLGSPAYMAPEQAGGGANAIGPAADVYALGAICYELLTGRPPFVAESALELLTMARSADPVPPSRLRPGLPRDVETICLRCLEKNPDHRYQTAEALADDFGRWLRGESILARPAGLLERGYRWSRRNQVVAGLIASVALTLVAGTTGMALLWGLARAEAANARELASKEAKARSDLARSSADLAIDRGLSLAEAGDAARGLPFLEQAARLDPDGSLGRAARANLGAWSPLVPRLDGSTLLEADFSTAVASSDREIVAIGGQDGSIAFWDVGRLRPLGRTPPIPGSVIEDLTIRSDGRVAASGSHPPFNPQAETTVQLWEVATGRPIGAPFRSKPSFARLKFSPDGSILAVIHGPTVHLLETSGGRVIASKQLGAQTLRSLAFSPDGSTLVAVGESVQAFQLDGRTAVPLREPIRLGGPGWSVVFHPDGSRFAVGFGNKSAEAKSHRSAGVQVFRTATGQPDGPQLPQNAASVRLAYRPDGQALLSGDDEGRAQLWDDQGRPIGDPLENNGSIAGVEFSPDGSIALTRCEAGPARLWDASTGEQVGAALDGRADFAAFGPDGGRLIRVSGRRLESFDITGALVQARSSLPPMRRLTFFPDGRKVVGAAGSFALITSTEAGRAIGWPMPHRDLIQAIAVSPDGNRIATGSRDATIRIWDSEGRPTLPPTPLPHWSAALCFSPDGRRLLSADESGAVRLLEVSTGRWLAKPWSHPARFDGSHVIEAFFSGDGRVGYSVSSGGTIARLDGTTGEPIGEPWDTGPKIQAAELSPDGRSLLLVHGTSVRVLDATTGKDQFPGLGSTVRSACFTPDGRMIVGGCSDRAVRFWHAGSGEPAGELPPQPQTITNVRVSPDGGTLLVIGEGGLSRIWDLAGRKPVGPARPNDSSLVWQPFSPDGRLVAITDQATRLIAVPRAEAGSTAQASRDAEWHARLGVDLGLRGNLAAASFHLDRFAKAVPGDWSGHALRSEVLANLGRRSEAFVEAARARVLAGASRSGPWEARLGLEAAGHRRWADAVAALDQALAFAVDPLGRAPLLDVRGLARARLGDWAGASSDLAAGTWRDSSMLDEYQHVILIALRAGDLPFYRSLAGHLLGPSVAGRKRADPVESIIAWYGSLGPDSLDNPELLVRLAEPASRLDRDRNDSMYGLIRGATLYRAGHDEAAISHLTMTRSWGRLDDQIEAQVFLAMACRRLGRTREARNWLALAKSQRAPDDWWEALACSILIAESEAIVLDTGFPRDPFHP
jgi:WD40 repeat protein